MTNQSAETSGSDILVTGTPSFSELEVGVELPPLVRGPLSTAHLMRWSAATENWHRIHYDLPYATQQENHAGLLVSGNFKQQLLTELVTDWLRPDGWVAEISFQFRRPNVAGETLTAWGRVTELRRWAAFGVVECEIGLVNEHGDESTPGKAVGILPLDGGPPVPYPFEVEGLELS